MKNNKVSNRQNTSKTFSNKSNSETNEFSNNSKSCDACNKSQHECNNRFDLNDVE